MFCNSVNVTFARTFKEAMQCRGGASNGCSAFLPNLLMGARLPPHYKTGAAGYSYECNMPDGTFAALKLRKHKRAPTRAEPSE
jgi:hypothetical protein